MKFPKLKNALLCRVLIYVVIFGAFIIPAVIVLNVPFIPNTVKVTVCVVLLVCLSVYLIKNRALLLKMDTVLSTVQYNNEARKYFTLRSSFDDQTAEDKIYDFGLSYEPLPVLPLPELFRHKNPRLFMGCTCGAETVILTYYTDFLDKEKYEQIFNSAKVNTSSIKRKNKRCLFGKAKKTSPCPLVSVAVIFAGRVDEPLRKDLFNTVCKSTDSKKDTALLTCVVDLQMKICTFDSRRTKNFGFQYAPKNRGINIIRKFLFDNKFTYGTSHELPAPVEGVNTEQSLWEFWRSAKK